MGLLLSVLVACVGVIELITFYYNVKRNVTLRPIPGDLSSVREGYIQGLYDVRKRIINDIQNLQGQTNNLEKASDSSNVQRPVPALRLNSHEDIEIEYNKNVLSRTGASGPRRFLVTEKEAENRSRERTPSPRRFVVSEEQQGIQRSRCEASIPEFLIQEQNNPKKSPNHPRYVLKDHEGRSRSPIPLPNQFVVTEEELDELVFQDASINENLYERSPSPYPPEELPHVARNSMCNELVDHPVVSVLEVDEEICRSRSPSPRNVDDVLEESGFHSKQYWKNKVLVVPSKKSKSRSPSPAYGKKHRSISPHVKKQHLEKTKLKRSLSKSESELHNCDTPVVTNNVTKAASNLEIGEGEGWSEPTSPYEVVEEEDFQENTSYDENYLNGLDGISKQKSFKRNRSSRKTIRRKNLLINDLEKASSSNSEESTESKNTRSVVSAVKELKQASPTNEIRESSEVAGGSKTADNKKPEPFWLIFSGEYTKAMNKDWHGQHFCCWQCDESLTGQRYVLRDDHPYCVSCYESVFANACEKCSRTIGIDSKDLSYKDKHWHEACFLCTSCGESLVDKQFGSKGDRIYCGNCYDQQFASRCDGCHEIFRAGTKKMEYKTRQWHEKCFCCCVCKVPIGTQSFIPREQEIYCAKCYEEKFATRCIKCNKVITSGGVTYKNEPWHRECFTCTHCQKSLAGERFTSRDEKPFCAECFGELFAKRCTACNKPITGIGGTKFISFEDRHWHNDCFFCASCRTSLVGRGFITDQEDIICPECAKQKLM